VEIIKFAAMGLLDIAIHLANFAAPALVVAALMLVFNLFWKGKQAPALARWAQLAINIVVGLAVLSAGLWFFGRDGMVLTYAALVVCVATSQWAMGRGWQR
jgi:hypothetical protein